VPAGNSTICGTMMPPDREPFVLNARTRSKVCVASGGTPSKCPPARNSQFDRLTIN